MAGSLSTKLPWDLANTKWAATLNPILRNPIVNGQLLKNLVLVSGANTINHNLGDELQGWLIVRNSASATFYDSQMTNPRPQLTLILNASAPTTVSLYVF